MINIASEIYMESGIANQPNRTKLLSKNEDCQSLRICNAGNVVIANLQSILVCVWFFYSTFDLT